MLLHPMPPLGMNSRTELPTEFKTLLLQPQRQLGRAWGGQNPFIYQSKNMIFWVSLDVAKAGKHWPRETHTCQGECSRMIMFLTVDTRNNLNNHQQNMN